MSFDYLIFKQRQTDQYIPPEMSQLLGPAVAGHPKETLPIFFFFIFGFKYILSHGAQIFTAGMNWMNSIRNQWLDSVCPQGSRYLLPSICGESYVVHHKYVCVQLTEHKCAVFIYIYFFAPLTLLRTQGGLVEKINSQIIFRPEESMKTDVDDAPLLSASYRIDMWWLLWGHYFYLHNPHMCSP